MLHDLQGLVQYYEERILPREKDLAFPIKLLIDRLMGMYPRKALTHWQRQELIDWIFDESSTWRCWTPILRGKWQTHFRP